MVATLILSKKAAKIGLAQGASLPGLAALLKGAGKGHRYIEVRAQNQSLQDEVMQLIEALCVSVRTSEAKETANQNPSPLGSWLEGLTEAS